MASRGYFQKLDVGPLHLRIDFLPLSPSLRHLLNPSAATVVQWLPAHNVTISLSSLRLGGQVLLSPPSARPLPPPPSPPQPHPYHTS